MSSKKRRTYNTNSSDSTEVNLPQPEKAVASSASSSAKSEKNRRVSNVGSVTTVYAPPGRVEGLGDEPGRNPIFLILCFLVPFIIMGICFAINGVFPFGERTVLYSDCKAQYFPFLQNLQDKLQNGGSLFYTWNTGMGSNFIAMIGYYIASPLNFLTVFVPSEYLVVAMAVLIMTKLSCASLFTGIFIKKVFRRNDFSLVAFGCCYSFCHFMMGYYWNVIWLDSVALLPLIALGVYNLVYLKKYKLYIISLAVAMISNYYIGFMLCIFVAMWFFMLWIKYPSIKGKNKLFYKSLISIIGYSVIAIGLSAIIILPSAIQLGNTVASNDTFPSKLEFYNSMFDILGNALGFHNPVTMQGLPNIYCGIICIVMIAVFIRTPKISSTEKILDIGFIVFLLISLNVNTLDYLWHGLHFPNQIPYRFAFIFCFFAIIVAYRAFSLAQYLEKSDIIAISVASAIMLFLGLISTMNKDEFSTMEKKSVVLSLLVVVIYIFVILLKVNKLIPMKVFTIAISLVIIAEMAANCYIGVKTVGTSDINYPDRLNDVQQTLSYIKDSDTDTSFYRVEMTDISSKNDGAYYGYNGISQFSSTSDKNVLNFMGKIGITAKRSSWHYMQTSPLVTSFFNIKHLISRDGYTASDTTLTYVTDTNGVGLYDYKYYLPLGFMANGDLAGMDINRYNYAYDAQNDLFRLSTGLDGTLFNEFPASSVEMSDGTITPLDKDGEYSYDAPDQGQSVTFTYTVPKDGLVYAYANFRDCSKRIEVSSNSVSRSVDIDARRYVFPVGDYKAGDTITFNSNLDLSSSGTVRLYVATFDEELYKQGYELLNDETFNIKNHSDTLFEGSITAKTDGVMWISIPYEKGGWTLYVDGKETDITPICDAFLGVKLTAGDHDIKLKYSPPGFTAGVAVSCIALAAFIALCVISYFKNKKEKAKEL